MALLAPVVASAQEMKLGHIDRTRLVLDMPERTAAATKLDGFTKTLEGRLKAMADEYTAKRATLENPNGGLTNTEKNMALRELQELEQRIMAAEEKAEEDVAKMERELMQPILARADEAIRAIASEQGFTYVIDSSAGMLVFTGSGVDLMSAVKAKLGMK